MESTESATRNSGTVRRLSTGSLPRLEPSALEGAKTLESRVLPRLFLGAFIALVVIQVWLAL